MSVIRQKHLIIIALLDVIFIGSKDKATTEKTHCLKALMDHKDSCFVHEAIHDLKDKGSFGKFTLYLKDPVALFIVLQIY